MAGMKFTSQVSLIDFDKAAWLRALNEEMTEVTKEAAKSWLSTVTVIIPTWSRASKATFQKLADAVGFSLSFGELKSDKDRSDLGDRVSVGELQIQKNHRWHFFYETDLRYLRHNEFNTATVGDGSNWFSTHRDGPGPYRFQEAGANDFRSFAENVKLPNPIRFISGKKI